MRVYLASATGNAAAARELAAELRAEGHVITSTWHDLLGIESARATEAALDDDAKRQIADRCLAEIRQAVRLVVLGHPDMRGALVEVGYALALRLAIEWRGADLTLFSALCEVRR